MVISMDKRICDDFPHGPVNGRIVVPRHVVSSNLERSLDSGTDWLRNLEEEVDDIATSCRIARTNTIRPANVLAIVLTVVEKEIRQHVADGRELPKADESGKRRMH